jgi:hypothetical protein
MSKPAWIWLLVVGLIVVLLVFPAAPGHASSHHHGGDRVFVGVWPAFLWGPPYYYPPEPVIVQQPQMYIQKALAFQAAATYCHYCPSANGHYPAVQTCSEPWAPVPPRNP